MFIWQLDNWPNFSWDDQSLTRLLMKTHREQGRLLGKMEALGFELRNEANLQNLTQEVVKSSEIEGEKLDSDMVRSSIARRLGMDIAGLVPADRKVEGVVEMMLDATRNYAAPLTIERLHAWNAALFPYGFSRLRVILAGQWRTDAHGPMQVVSGPLGREKVHFEAPPATELDSEIDRFLSWFNTNTTLDPLLKAGIAHLWFVTIHPFEDGNGRIARAVTEMALARGEDTQQRAYSMSSQIRKERNEYYALLESTQKSSLDLTSWLEWFLGCLSRAVDDAQSRLDVALGKARFWDRFGKEALNERQIKVLQRVMREDWQGNLTSSKWAKIADCSQDTAGRDIKDLIGRGALTKNIGGGRSTNYSINLASALAQGER